MNNSEMIEQLNDRLIDLCGLFEEMALSNMSDEEREIYEKRKRYYEERFNRNRNKEE